ncbi:MAG: hypothetical protein WC330_06090 [Candidatus Omnitrophota bacterium]|jgi:hypothetical protein
MKIRYFGIFLILLTFIFIFAHNVYTQNTFRAKAIARVLVFEALSESEKKELLELRKTDKEKFRAILKVKLIAKKEELERLKKNDPEKFKSLIEEARIKIKSRLAELKKNNPQKYEELKARRREHLKKRLEFLKENNPKKYEELKKKIQEHRTIHPIEGNL